MCCWVSHWGSDGSWGSLTDVSSLQQCFVSAAHQSECGDKTAVWQYSTAPKHLRSLALCHCLSVCLNVSLSLSLSLTYTHSLSCIQHFGNEFRNKQTHKIYYITYSSLLMKQIMTFSRFIRLGKDSLFCTFCVFCSICFVVFLARKLFWLAT